MKLRFSRNGLLGAGIVLTLLSGAPLAAEQQVTAERLQEGWRVFNRTCTVCHWPGVGGAPMVGDKKAWEARIQGGMQRLYTHAISGFDGASGKRMPARGGNWNLTDEQVEAAVDYMVHNSK